jgi:hypothetical protein
MYPSTTLTPQQRADIHARARRQAQLLRRAAVADFWHSVYGYAVRVLRTVRAATKTATTTANPSSHKPSHKPSGV